MGSVLARPAPVQAPGVAGLLGEMPDDITLRIGTFLDARSLTELACLSRQFRRLALEAARRRLTACAAEERAWVRSQYELGGAALVRALHDVELLRAPPTFTLAHPSVTLSDAGKTASRDAAPGHLHAWTSSPRPACCGAVMHSGCHSVQFTMVRGTDLMAGVVTAGWDVASLCLAHSVAGHCFFWAANGRCYPWGDPRGKDWGASGAEESDRITLLLDCDAGSLSVSKNDVALGVMEPCELRDQGGYRWAVALPLGVCVHIDAAPEPAPTPLPTPMIGES